MLGVLSAGCYSCWQHIRDIHAIWYAIRDIQVIWHAIRMKDMPRTQSLYGLNSIVNYPSDALPNQSNGCNSSEVATHACHIS